MWLETERKNLHSINVVSGGALWNTLPRFFPIDEILTWWEILKNPNESCQFWCITYEWPCSTAVAQFNPCSSRSKLGNMPACREINNSRSNGHVLYYKNHFSRIKDKTWEGRLALGWCWCRCLDTSRFVGRAHWRRNALNSPFSYCSTVISLPRQMTPMPNRLYDHVSPPCWGRMRLLVVQILKTWTYKLGFFFIPWSRWYYLCPASTNSWSPSKSTNYRESHVTHVSF